MGDRLSNDSLERKTGEGQREERWMGEEEESIVHECLKHPFSKLLLKNVKWEARIITAMGRV